MYAITAFTWGTYLNVYSATSSASRRTSRSRCALGVPLPTEHSDPIPQNWSCTFPLVAITRSNCVAFAERRKPIAEIFVTFVPRVTSGSPGRMATSWSPAAFALYRGAMWSAISWVIFAVLPVSGFHDDHGCGFGGPGRLATITTP